MLVRTREGRAVKVEGNPEHPISKGGLCIRGQASLQGLYNPDRFRGPLRRGANGAKEPMPWAAALDQIAQRVRAIRESRRTNRAAFLTSHAGPAMRQLMGAWMGSMPSEFYLEIEPFSHLPSAQANSITFGPPASFSELQIAESDYLLSFGTDFLETWLSPVGFSREFAATRQVRDGQVGKFVHIEPRLSLTAANADEWVAIRPGSEMDLALGMTRLIVEQGIGARLAVSETQRLRSLLEPWPIEGVSRRTDVAVETIERLAAEFARSQSGLAIGGGVAVTGENATATLVGINLLNYVTGRIGKTVRPDRSYSPSRSANLEVLRWLIESMNRGDVELLFVHHANPVFSLPAELGFSDALKNVPMVVSFASCPDETTSLAHLVLPDHTALEQWGDASPADNLHSLLQPAMNPVFDTRSAGDVLLQLAALAGIGGDELGLESFYDYVKERWRERYEKRRGEDFEILWREALQRGGEWDEPPAINQSSEPRAAQPALSPRLFDFEFPVSEPERADGLFLHVYPSSRHYDGRGANRPWLQEIPDPITNVVWDSWVEMHPATAASLGVIEGDLVRIESDAGAVEAPAYIYEGVRRDTVAMPIGQGHTAFGRYASGVGANPIKLLPTRQDMHTGVQAWAGVLVRLSKTGRRRELVRTDGSLTDQGRGFAQIIPLSALTGQQNQAVAARERDALPDLYAPHEHKDYRWGMAINLSSCTGCGACVAACYAENNVPVVGKERVAQGRHMAWIRIERYLENISASPDVRFSPMMCQQCDNAPCEPVCPVYASVHSSDGLNEQVYNRCVGTRYCSNNCPYKVRVFNWFDYEFPEPLHLQLNPDVSVRGRGVMEKCTFCVQRIREAKDHAKDERRLVRDGEIAPACAQSCPAQAITFGNLLDPESAVSRSSGARHGYKVLEDLNTRPAITYLPRVRRT
jgi:molybdopterin-containing oxidoreductase family iron-sulfur binding subunit